MMVPFFRHLYQPVLCQFYFCFGVSSLVFKLGIYHVFFSIFEHNCLILLILLQKNCDDGRASSETREFKDLTKRDALDHLKADVQCLLETVPAEQREAARKNFNGFISYYEKFLKQDSNTVDWDKIEKLPNDAVRI